MSAKEVRKRQTEIRNLNAKRRRLQGKTLSYDEALAAGVIEPHPKRLTVSEVARTLLNRTPREMSHVGLTRNSRGDTQIEVVVYVGEDENAKSIEAAKLRCQKLYNELVKLYPMVER